MVARLKLKGIDGRAPPGVEDSRLQRLRAAADQAALVGPQRGPATLSNCGEALDGFGCQAFARERAGGRE